MYQLRDVVKTYAGREVCHIEHLDIERGTILTIMGPNGAGKSTLLRMLDFLEPPTAGTIVFEGRAIANGAAVPLALRRQVTMVFQNPVMLDASVEENVAYGLRLRGKRDARQEVHELLQQMGLLPLSRSRATKLSVGEAQRVALARALLIEPAVLLLDEPTANLDPHSAALIEQVVLRTNQEKQTTIVLVTHNVFQARRVAREVALLLNGRIVEAGPSAQLFEAPTDPRTGAFIRGEMVY